MSATDTVTLELTQEELHMVKGALESFMTDFGHDEADIHRTTRIALAKVNSVLAPAPATGGPTAP